MASDQKRLFLALTLSALVLFVWQAYFAPKPNFDATISKASQDQNGVTSPAVQSSGAQSVSNQASQSASPSPVSPVDNGPVITVVVSQGTDKITLSSNLKIIGHESELANDELSQVIGERTPFQIFAITNGQRTLLNLSDLQAQGNSVSGRDDTLGISFKGLLDESGLFHWSLTSQQPFQYVIVYESEKKEGDARQIRQFLSYFRDVERFNIDDNETFDGKLQWFGVDFHYHLFATVLDEKAVASVTSQNQTMVVKIVEPTTKLSAFNIFTKKSYDDLNKLGSNLHLSVDFGVFGVIAVPILKGLQFFYKYIPNYGLAIILITLLIRTLLFPLQYKSFKSMKKMQKLQPELAKVKEKYGDDPQRMQKETMELFKRNGANPMGGCLPLILQMPVFFAFYQVLFNSVELLNAPFMLWINDLSVKDPYYVLPVLMGAAMFGQTKLNPSTTADPTQQKMMMFMPLIFTFFMKDLPAGLNLYIFVSTLFGILQQLFVYKTVD
jgi:YidC/Oxa1 family membrane protein insertase